MHLESVCAAAEARVEFLITTSTRMTTLPGLMSTMTSLAVALSRVANFILISSICGAAVRCALTIVAVFSWTQELAAIVSPCKLHLSRGVVLGIARCHEGSGHDLELNHGSAYVCRRTCVHRGLR